MRLKLSLTRYPPDADESAAEHLFDERGGVIGRGEDCAWQLRCPDNLLSRRHAAITFQQGVFRLYDASTNGVYVNGSDQPLGPGGDHVLADGDELRMGGYLMRAALLEEPAETEPADAPGGNASTPPATAAPGAPTRDEMPAPPEGPDAPRLPDLGNPTQAFSPPTAHIPEDWDFRIEGCLEGDRDGHPAPVSKTLESLQPAAVAALIDGLGLPSEDADRLTLRPSAAGALGCALRECLEAAFALDDEYRAADRELRGVPPAEGPDGSGTIAGHPNAPSLARALLQDGDDASRAQALEGLATALARLRGRHARVTEILLGGLDTVIEQFSPYRFQRGARQTEGFARFWWMLRRRVLPRSTAWLCYRAWYESQGGDAHRVVHRLFEKRRLALYARRLRPLGRSGCIRAGSGQGGPQADRSDARRVTGGSA